MNINFDFSPLTQPAHVATPVPQEEIEPFCTLKRIWLISGFLMHLSLLIAMASSLRAGNDVESTAKVFLVGYCMFLHILTFRTWHCTAAREKYTEDVRRDASCLFFTAWAALCMIIAGASHWSMGTGVACFVVVPTVLWGLSKCYAAIKYTPGPL